MNHPLSSTPKAGFRFTGRSLQPRARVTYK